MTTTLTSTPSLQDYLEARAAAQATASESPASRAGRDQEMELRRRQVAEYTTRRLLAIEREMALAQAQAEAALADIQAWLEEVLTPLRTLRAQELIHLRALGEAHLAAHPKGAKHLDVRVGRTTARVSFSVAPSSLKVLDEAQALAALQEAGLTKAIKTEEIPARVIVKPVLAELKKLLVKPHREAARHGEPVPAIVAATGEVLPGLGWELDPELRVKVEPPKTFARKETEELDAASALPSTPAEETRPEGDLQEAVSLPLVLREDLLAQVAADPEAAGGHFPAALIAEALAEEVPHG